MESTLLENYKGYDISILISPKASLLRTMIVCMDNEQLYRLRYMYNLPGTKTIALNTCKKYIDDNLTTKVFIELYEVQDIIELLSGHNFKKGTEEVLRFQVQELLEQNRIPHARDYFIDEGVEIDFMLDEGIGIEVMIGKSNRTKYSWCLRLTNNNVIKKFILITDFYSGAKNLYGLKLLNTVTI